MISASNLAGIAGLASQAAGGRCYGKYRGTVLNNVDPERRGRIQVLVSEISPAPLAGWALPCVPIGGPQNGMFALPIPGATVWIEFESGDPDYPVWTGCFWGSAAEVPSKAKQIPPLVPAMTFQTPLGNSIVLTDLPGPTGGIQLQTATGARISITDLGIEIDNGRGASIKLIGSVVDVNNQALTIV